MASIQPQAATDQPFFSDTRSLADKVNVDERKWTPNKPAENCPPVLYGLVLELGSFTSAYDDNNTVTTARVLAADGVEWSVAAFHGWLQSEFNRKKPREGDFVAIAYQGEGEARKGENPPHRYRMVVERNPDNPVLVATPQVEGESPAEADPAEAPATNADDDGIPF